MLIDYNFFPEFHLTRKDASRRLVLPNQMKKGLVWLDLIPSTRQYFQEMDV